MIESQTFIYISIQNYLSWGWNGEIHREFYKGKDVEVETNVGPWIRVTIDSGNLVT